MFSIIPSSYEFETSLTPKQVAKKLNQDLIEYRPTINVMAMGRFMRKHRFESCYYGCRTGQYEFRVFHHSAKKRDGGATGFYGRIEQSENGSVIKGKFRKPVFTYVVAVLWTIVTLLLALILFAVGEKIGALCFLGILIAGIVIMFLDNKKPIIKAYLDSFPKVNKIKG